MANKPSIFKNKNYIFLLLNNLFQIEYVSSSLEYLEEDIFQEGLHFINDVSWSGTFIEPPNNIDEIQILYALDRRPFLCLFNQIKEHSHEISYIVSLIDLSEMNKLNSSINKELVLESSEFVTVSEPMQKINKIINTISNVDSTVLLLGESGVGKSAIATIIHQSSNRSQHPFISINCGSIPENLIETELFGYEHGTFTGGIKGGKAGLFEAADKGTIFLDEITELPLNLQSKLLSVLQENTVRRVGSTGSIKINVRVIAATNNDIKKLVDNKQFREDLYYRLNVVPLTIPSLRERKEDIPYLIDVFLAKFNKRYGLNKRLSNKVRRQLENDDWPGNIRELENMIERLVVTNADDEIDSDFHPKERQNYTAAFHSIDIMPLKKAKQALEKELILKAINLYGNTYKAAEALGVDQSTISKKMQLYKKGEV